MLHKTNALFQQIYDDLCRKIEAGEWKENEKLPSIRKLADELGVHRLTVFKAYQLLKEHQKVYVKEKSGYYVKGELAISHHPIVAAYTQRNHLSEIHQVPAAYQFSVSLIDPNLLPNAYFSDYVKRVFDLYPKVLGTYASVQGDEELRTALANYFGTTHRFQVNSEELLVTSGSQQAIDLLAKIFIRPRDVVLVERPTYSSAMDTFRQHGAHIKSITIHPYGYDLDEVEHCMKVYKPRFFYTNPTFHNPTGYTVPPSQRKKLVALAEQYHCVIVEDDPFRDIYFYDAPPSPIFTYDTDGHVVYIRSFSKYVSPGLRIAVIACRMPLMKSLLTAKSLADNGTPLLNQKIFLHYFLSQRLQLHIAKLRTALWMRKEAMEKEMTQSDWYWEQPDGGLNLWVQLPTYVSMKTLLQKAHERSISFAPGRIFDVDGEFHSWIRLSYSYMNERELRTGIAQLIALTKPEIYV
ncbi:PLP-dependent aminotransferase family protein [Priestia koreensis]|uniref:aminotransferase-like domain-containing protein n=1 Tax=Priestia koreensis TaxID=284581 RepID=UPI001F59EFB2|nr:PLP-dependent aminotransferase family protein [Priestia koreensis]MCM3005002.1 PLP-dependent aminotransferase family protein [Priestia koreensis]